MSDCHAWNEFNYNSFSSRLNSCDKNEMCRSLFFLPGLMNLLDHTAHRLRKKKPTNQQTNGQQLKSPGFQYNLLAAIQIKLSTGRFVVSVAYILTAWIENDSLWLLWNWWKWDNLMRVHVWVSRCHFYLSLWWAFEHNGIKFDDIACCEIMVEEWKLICNSTKVGTE